MNRQEIEAEVRKLAKRVNQNFVRIERAGIESSSYAYQFAQDALKSNRDIRSGRTKGQKIENLRFEESEKGIKNLTDEQLEKEFKALKNFDESKTRSVSGIRQVNKNKQEGLERAIKDLTGQDIDKKQYDKIVKIFGATETYKNINRYISSKQIIQSVMNKAKTQEDLDNIIKAFEDANEYLLNGPKPKVKTKEQADLLNDLFDRKIFGFADFSPNLTDWDDSDFINSKFGGL